MDELVTAVAWAVVRPDHAEKLARLAVDEGGFGNYPDKVAKISKRVTGVLADMTGLRTVGVVEADPQAGLVKIAKPVGVVAALIPTTGPDATPPVKALFALKGRNAIICAPHPRTTGATEAVVGFMRDACRQVGAPEDLVQSLPAPSLAKTQELMRQADLVVATGGAGMVKAAYSSGTPAYGVGVGNSVHVVDETADLADAASAILAAKTFDYATSCLADNALIVHADVYDDLMRRLTAAGAHLCDQAQKTALQTVMWPDGGPVPSVKVVAKSAEHIAGLAGFTVAADCPMLLVEEDGTGPDHPFSGEKLSVVLAIYRYEGGIGARRGPGQHDHRLPGPGPHLRHPHQLRRERGPAGRHHPHGPGAGQPEPERGRGQPAQRAAVHAEPELRDLGWQHHHRERERPALHQPDLGVPPHRAQSHQRGGAVRRPLARLRPVNRLSRPGWPGTRPAPGSTGCR